MVRADVFRGPCISGADNRHRLHIRLRTTFIPPRIICPIQTQTMGSIEMKALDEVQELWFGGLDFGAGKPFPREALERWFRSTPEFDEKCRYSHFTARNLIIRKFEPVIRELPQHLPTTSSAEGACWPS